MLLEVTSLGPLLLKLSTGDCPTESLAGEGMPQTTSMGSFTCRPSIRWNGMKPMEECTLVLYVTQSLVK